MRPFTRHQLAAYSPLTLDALARGVPHALGIGGDSWSVLRDLLHREYESESVTLCGSGTQALQLALGEAQRRLGELATVALPAFTCFNVATAAVGADACVALYDIDPDTLGPDFDSLERVLAAGARILVVSPLYGLPVDWDEVEATAARHGAVVIEDAAQGHGAAWRGRPLGSLGELGVLSFGRGKGWTGGRGGALLSRGGGDGGEPRPTGVAGGDAAVLLAAVAQWGLGRPSLYGLPSAIPWLGLGETRYHEPASPRAMDGAAAGLILRLRRLAASEADVRRANARFWSGTVQRLGGVRTLEPLPDAAPGWLRFPIRLEGGLAGLPARGRARRLGIAPGYPSTLAELVPVRRRMVRGQGRWPGAEALARELVTLPTHSRLRVGDRDGVLRLLSRVDTFDSCRPRCVM